MVEINDVRESAHHGTCIPVKNGREVMALRKKGSLWGHSKSSPSPRSGRLSKRYSPVLVSAFFLLLHPMRVISKSKTNHISYLKVSSLNNGKLNEKVLFTTEVFYSSTTQRVVCGLMPVCKQNKNGHRE